jgi:YVTN family beta-propeller protein
MRIPRPLASSILGVFLAVRSSCGFATDTGLVFISNEGSNDLTVIDSRTNKIVKRLKTARQPREMHFNADRTKLYVVCGGDAAIDILDVAQSTVVGRLDASARSETFGIDEKLRRIYISNAPESSLDVVDIDQNVIIQKVQTGAEPDGILVSKDGRFVYVTSVKDDLIQLIDANGGYVVEATVVGTKPRRIVATPDGKELWATTELSGEVYIIDRANFSVAGKLIFLPPGQRKIDVTPVDLLMSPDGGTAYVSLGRAGQIAIVDVLKRTIDEYIPTGGLVQGLAMTRGGNTLYVADRFNDRIMAIDLKSRKTIASISVGRAPWSVVIDD